ncbi:hypothetical protein [Nonomuraea rubra]
MARLIAAGRSRSTTTHTETPGFQDGSDRVDLLETDLRDPLGAG